MVTLNGHFSSGLFNAYANVFYAVACVCLNVSSKNFMLQGSNYLCYFKLLGFFRIVITLQQGTKWTSANQNLFNI